MQVRHTGPRECALCHTHMHLTTECTALSPSAINGIKEMEINAMLLCNTCVESNERDNFFRGRALASASEKLESLKVGKNLKNMEKRLTDLVDSKIGEARLLPPWTKSRAGNPKGAQNSNHNINQYFRIQGLKEDPWKSKAKNFVLTNSELSEIMFTTGTEPHVLELKRLGKIDPERKNLDTFCSR